jgi:hypothetical protein
MIITTIRTTSQFPIIGGLTVVGGELEHEDLSDVVTPQAVHVDNSLINQTLMACIGHKVWYYMHHSSSCHQNQTKLAKMLNDMQAPKTMYSNSLWWGHDVYTQGYDFAPHPHGGNK